MKIHQENRSVGNAYSPNNIRTWKRNTETASNLNKKTLENKQPYFKSLEMSEWPTLINSSDVTLLFDYEYLS